MVVGVSAILPICFVTIKFHQHDHCCLVPIIPLLSSSSNTCGLLYHYPWPMEGAHHCSQGWWFPDLGRRFVIVLNDGGTLA